MSAEARQYALDSQFALGEAEDGRSGIRGPHPGTRPRSSWCSRVGICALLVVLVVTIALFAFDLHKQGTVVEGSRQRDSGESSRSTGEKRYERQMEEKGGIDARPAKPESEWLTEDVLNQMLSELEYETTTRAGALTVMLRGDDNSERPVIVWWSDMDSLTIQAGWRSKQPVPKLSGPSGDAPIAGAWNSQRRYATVSIRPGETQEESQLLMTMDQMVHAKGGRTKCYGLVKQIVKRSVEKFRSSIVEFDEFMKRSYDDWGELNKQRYEAQQQQQQQEAERQQKLKEEQIRRWQKQEQQRKAEQQRLQEERESAGHQTKPLHDLEHQQELHDKLKQHL